MALNVASQTKLPNEGPGGPQVVPPAGEPPAIADLAPHFPQLEILAYLGRGGMGVVYKARQPRLDRLVALKLLVKREEADPAFAERFTREARALAHLSHPNIVAVHDFGETAGFYYLVMEFVDGVNLRQLLQARQVSPAEALAIVPKICEALQYAHDQGIVHRDIKPENILVDKRGRVKIADFGLAKLLGVYPQPGRLTEANQVMGTPHYMAPEQTEHPQAVDHRADIYSLGVVFYEMLTGELPLGRFAPPSEKVQVDVRLDEVVLRTLAKEPERRYQHASQVKTDLETIARTPRAAGGQAGPPKFVRGARALAFWLKKKWPWVAGLSLLVVALALGLMMLPEHQVKILGVVTDAATGQPIPKARVADLIYNAGPRKPPRETWTDGRGGFELSTSYEEHTMAASAPGYELQLHTLLTKVWGFEREVRMDFTLRPTNALAQGAAEAPTLRKFVRLVVAANQMTFEGQLVTWDTVRPLLERVPDRPHTVLELAIPSNDITLQQHSEWISRGGELARQYGFEYPSFIGVHPLGSVGGEP
jgi:tRNA A-37 threonylcarbamoyl transferase component Bud32